MDSAAGYGNQTDRELAIGVRNGDRQAFAALFERYLPGVYDLVVRTLLDPDAAVRVTEASFREVWRTIRAGDIPDEVRPRIFGIAREQAIAEARRAQAGTPSPAAEAPTTSPSFIETRPENPPIDRDYRQSVWSAAGEFNPSEYSTLHLHTRAGLTPAELGTAIAASGPATTQMVQQLGTHLNESVGASFVVLRGRSSGFSRGAASV